MNKQQAKFIIVLSNAEYLTGYQMRCASSTPWLSGAKVFYGLKEARAVLRKVKAHVDSGAGLQEV